MASAVLAPSVISPLLAHAGQPPIAVAVPADEEAPRDRTLDVSLRLRSHVMKAVNGPHSEAGRWKKKLMTLWCVHDGNLYHT